MTHVLFIAAESAALPGGKVGGIGDVVRDLPLALADEGCTVAVLMPAYGFLQQLPGARRERSFTVDFAGRQEQVELYRVPAGRGDDATRVEHLLLEHPYFSPHGPGHIYWDDGPQRPFATDATKFAFLCAAAATYLRDYAAQPDVVHLHDWHAALLLLLREADPAFAGLRSLRCVYTIHNLALQGIRPRWDDESSLQHWFPGLAYQEHHVRDARYADCVNLMAVGIRLADRVNTVSPTYAQEVLLPNDPAAGFSGGEGLEADTQAAMEQGRLVGILNGCMYPSGRRPRGWQPLARALAGLGKEETTIQPLLRRFRSKRPVTIVTSVGRVTEQKVALLLQAPGDTAPTALDAILAQLGSDSLFVMLGSGDAQLEARLREVIARHDNALLVSTFSEQLAQHLYACGDLFLMPSSFEPCGISQMLAMRAGQPCVVHGVGGLRDTVVDHETGFVFNGDNPLQQAMALVAKFAAALELRRNHSQQWQKIRRAAAAKRFTWRAAARAYLSEMYAHD